MKYVQKKVTNQKTAFLCKMVLAIKYRTIRLIIRDRRGRDHMVVGFITTYAISAYNY